MEIPEQEQDHLRLLRRRAEEALQGKQVEVSGLSEQDIQFLMHELQVHQAELGMQNEELRQTQETLEVSRDRYATLYDFAPAGYCTISQKDVIVEANQSLANLLDVVKQALLQKPYSSFVSRIDQDKYYLFRRRAFEKHGHESGEIRMVKHSGDLVYVRLESMLAEGKDQLMIMVIDITNQRDLQRRIIEQREKERQKIARDLHDGPIQMLAAINFNLQRILMGNPDKELVKSLEAIQADLRDQIQVLRGFSVELRSPLLAHIGLETALRSTIDNFAEQHPDILIRLAINPLGVSLREEARVALLRICQESLQNVSKHAKKSTTTMNVRLEKMDNNLVLLEISDNGMGFELPGDWLRMAKEGHLGIIGMRERAEAIGGQLEIQSGESGTLVRAVVPIDGEVTQ